MGRLGRLATDLELRSLRPQPQCFCPYACPTWGPDPPGRRGEPRANRKSRAPRRIVQGGAEADGRRSRCPGFRRHKSRDRRGREHQNNLSRNGGFSPSQWVFGTLPRGPSDQFDEQEFADLGPLQGQLEPGTTFARRAELGASARRAFIREDCGRRVARAVLRKAAPLVGEYATGDIVCYRKNDQGWSPACRLVGFDGNKIAWLICAGVPMCAAVDLLRPTSSEAVAMQFARNVRYEPGHPEDQQAFVDARAPLDHGGDERAADPPEDRPADDPNDPETPRSLVERGFEHGNTPPLTRPRSSEDLLDDGPFALRRRVGIDPSSAIGSHAWRVTGRSGRLAYRPLGSSGTTGPGVDLVERQQDRERDEADALIAFYTDRGVGYKYRSKKGGKRSKNIHSSGSKSTKMSTNGAKVVLVSPRCSKVDQSAAEIWRKPLV